MVFARRYGKIQLVVFTEINNNADLNFVENYLFFRKKKNSLTLPKSIKKTLKL